VSANLQGGKTLNLCGCAWFGETELLKVMRAMSIISEQLAGMNGAIIETLQRVEKAVRAGEERIAVMEEHLRPKPRLAEKLESWWKKMKPKEAASETKTS
jgi:TnpA family transposase